MSRKFVIALATCAWCTGSVAQTKPMRPGPVSQPQAVGAPAPAIVPLSPEQMPATPPQVAFNNGILTIMADNSTLGDVLRAVHRQTGAAIEVPGNATERVVGKFGPGAPRDVLSALLNGSHFNYVLLGSATNSSALDRVILTSRPAGADEAQSQQPAQQAGVGMAGTPTPPMAATTPQPAENADFNDDSNEVLQQPEDGTGDQGDQAQSDDQPPQPTQPFAPGGAVRTPEQLLQELQQRQQQLQQQQQQPGQPFPGNQGGVPQQPQPPQ